MFFLTDIFYVVYMVQHVGIIMALFVCLEGLIKFFSALRDEKKMQGCGLLGGISAQADTMDFKYLYS